MPTTSARTLGLPRALALVVALAAVACSSSPGGGTTTSNALCPGSTTPATVPATGAPDLTEVTSFGDNPGALKMFVHVPASGKATAIVVALHGCTQGASDYAGAGWNELADAADFVVVYPEQTTANNYQRCFRWFDKTQIERGAGEARSIAAMAEHAKAQYGATHAYVTGLSAGAAMTAVMLATYSDLFEAGAIMAGLPYACATSQNDAYTCMSPGRDQSAAAWAALVPASARGMAPRVSIWHGDADWIVRPTNETQLVRQWAGVAGIASEQPSATTTEGGATHAEYKDAAGRVRVESWLVKGMGHGVALAPQAGCGRAGAYMLDEGVCSTAKAAAFFGLLDASGSPSTPPTPGEAPGAPAATGMGTGAKGKGSCDP